MSNLADELRAKTKAGGSERTELQETTTRDAVTTHDVVERLLGMHGNSPFVHECKTGCPLSPAELFERCVLAAVPPSFSGRQSRAAEIIMLGLLH
jgi:hypothetical protein